MATYPTLLVNGVDLRAVAGVKVIGSLASIVYAPGTLRGSNDVIAGARGQRGADLVLDAYAGAVLLEVQGVDNPAREAALHSLLTSIRSGLSSLVTLERRLASGAGYVAATAAGQITGNAVTVFNPSTGRCELQVVNLDGAWTTDGGTTWVL